MPDEPHEMDGREIVNHCEKFGTYPSEHFGWPKVLAYIRDIENENQCLQEIKRNPFLDEERVLATAVVILMSRGFSNNAAAIIKAIQGSAKAYRVEPDERILRRQPEATGKAAPNEP